MWCTKCAKKVEYPVPRYRLELVVGDNTGETIFVLFDDVAFGLIQLSATEIIDKHIVNDDEEYQLPPALLNLIDTTHVFQLKVSSFSKAGGVESFMVNKMVTDSKKHENTSSNDNATIDLGKSNAIGQSSDSSSKNLTNVHEEGKSEKSLIKRRRLLLSKESDDEEIREDPIQWDDKDTK
ncbi:hypothetical protein SLEP1_g53032 [Rubroshorea leprosula]|uniref:Replication factor A C-terminal domain-containing protein n=1 Tax=Rubroshorea leprosula TaxID=152421 RepID=A0AAV5M852_9ROSI|nr:hypothetical protein SLEP1_g53032 [Rubroshorea leprosula]